MGTGVSVAWYVQLDTTWCIVSAKYTKWFGLKSLALSGIIVVVHISVISAAPVWRMPQPATMRIHVFTRDRANDRWSVSGQVGDDWPTHLLPPNGATHRLWCVASGLLKLHMPQSTVTCNWSRYCKFFWEPTRQRMGHLKYDELLNHSSASTSVFLWRVLCSCLTARCVKIQFICKAHLVNLRIWPMRCASGKCTFDQSPNKIWFM